MLEQSESASFEPEFAGIVEAAPVGVLLVNAEGQIAYVNAALENMFGYDRAAMLGQSVEMLLPEDRRAAHVDFRKMFFRAPAARTMGSGRELYARHRSGDLFPIEIGLGMLGSGGRAQAAAFVIDISARRNAEQRLAALIDALPVGVLVANQEGKIELANPSLARMFGYEMAELRGQTIEMLLPGRMRAQHPKLREGYMDAPAVRGMGEGRDLLAQHKFGLEFPVEVALSPIATKTGRLVLAVVSDISLRKSLEDQLKLANTNLEEFTYVASHDLRSPLRGIADLLSWIKEDLGADQLSDTVSRNFERAEVRIEKAERMIDELLDYARAGARDSVQVDFDLAELVQEAITLVHNPAGVIIENLVEETHLNSARVPLATAVRNLIDNAVKHIGRPDGRVALRCREGQHYFVISVEDNGPGIAEGSEERIFKLFHRASTTTTGSGVGLAMTRRMIQTHGGQVRLAKPQILSGACFEVLWPRFKLKEQFDDE